MSAYSLQQQLLTLTLIAYQGYAELVHGPEAQARLAKKIEESLRSFEPLEEAWELVWGPGMYRSRLSLLDDVVVYVARDMRELDKPRYAVVIRGTNPVSAFDWVFGDFWVGQTVAWAWGTPEPGAALSMSSALGLAVMQRLEAPGDVPAAFGLDLGALWDGVQAKLERLEEAAVRKVETAASSLVTHLDELGIIEEIDDAEARTLTLVQRHGSKAWKAARAAFGATFGKLSAELQQALLHGIVQRAEQQQDAMPGANLASFLSTLTEDAQPEILVTGHSKGGALASVLAKWLADTRGPLAAEHERWDPDRAATVSCVTFASPSPGNKAFADSFDNGLRERSLRVANHNDIVTHAWEPALILELPGLYPHPPVVPLPGLGPLARLVVNHTRSKHYHHAPGPVELFEGGIANNQKTFPTQVIYQHLEAYLHHLDLADIIDRERVFGFPLVGGDPLLER